MSVIADLDDVEPFLPKLDPRPALVVHLSSEVVTLLEEGSRRVRETQPVSVPRPMEPVAATLPPEIAAMVDELLADEDDLPATGAGGSAVLAPPASRPTTSLAATQTASQPDPAVAAARIEAGDSAKPPATELGLPPATASVQPPDPANPPVRRKPDTVPPGTIPMGAPHLLARHPAAGGAPHEREEPGDVGPPSRAPMSAIPSDARLGGPGPATSMPPARTQNDWSAASAPESGRFRQLTDPMSALASAIAHRTTGSLALAKTPSTDEPAPPARRIVLRDGDLVMAASDVPTERLIDFLTERGDISVEVAQARAARLPRAGRHAAAALIANGLLGQDELWSVLRAHAEWIIGRAMLDAPCQCDLERELPERLRTEPNVFGGAAGVEVFVEILRRILAPDEAVRRLGGPQSVIEAGKLGALLAESALGTEEQELLQSAAGLSVGRLVGTSGSEFAPVLVALVLLEALRCTPVGRPAGQPHRPDVDPLDASAVRERVRARMELVQDADYFALLGVAHGATSYEIRRAYLAARNGFDPSKLLTPATADLADDVAVIREVIEEAYQILRDAHRRERYRKAIESTTA